MLVKNFLIAFAIVFIINCILSATISKKFKLIWNFTFSEIYAYCCVVGWNVFLSAILAYVFSKIMETIHDISLKDKN